MGTVEDDQAARGQGAGAGYDRVEHELRGTSRTGGATNHALRRHFGARTRDGGDGLWIRHICWVRRGVSGYCVVKDKVAGRWGEDRVREAVGQGGVVGELGSR